MMGATPTLTAADNVGVSGWTFTDVGALSMQVGALQCSADRCCAASAQPLRTRHPPTHRPLHLGCGWPLVTLSFMRSLQTSTWCTLRVPAGRLPVIAKLEMHSTASHRPLAGPSSHIVRLSFRLSN
jgi:hypothetical protein